MPDYNIPLSTVNGAADKIDSRLPLNSEGTEMPFKLKQFENVDPISNAARAYSLANSIGNFQEAQAERMDAQMMRETKARDQAILKAYQQSGGGLHSSDDLDTALFKLKDKLSPETVENLAQRKDAAKTYETNLTDKLMKAPSEYIDVMSNIYDYGIKEQMSVKSVYDQTLAKTGDPQQALAAFNAAKQARLQVMAQEKLPGTNQNIFNEQTLQQFQNMTPEQLNSAIEGSKYNQSLLNNIAKRKLEESQTAAADALAKQRQETTAEMPEKLKLIKEKLEKSAGQALSDDDANTMAEYVRTSGPTALSRFGLTGDQKRQVIDKVAKLNSGEGKTAREGAVATANFKEDEKSLGVLKKQYDAINAYDKTMNYIGGKVKELADKVDATGIPVIERWIRAGKQAIAGDPDVTEFNSRMQTFKVEAARVINNPNLTGVLSDSARHEIADTIPNSSSAEQIKRGVDTLIDEGAQRKKNLNEQITDVQTRMKGGGPEMKIAPDVQKKRDDDRLPILQQERDKETKALQAAQTPEDKDRATKNIAAIDREIKRIGGAPSAKAAPAVSDDEMAKWAKDHPDDPRSKKILELLNG